MTNNEAVSIIRKEYLCVDRDCDIERNCGKCDLVMPSKEPILQAYKMAIKALEQETKTGQWEHGRELSRVFISGVLKGINYEDWHCSNCHCVVEQSIKPKWSYCPNCGAKMQEVEE